ncbi:MAG: hypothetical protein M0P73_11765 [Syntrophobacterales bacterium]|jgi:uncharacterized integral membrane protein|nr:hypothetical protein [Syntrophobacterales bacterium]
MAKLKLILLILLAVVLADFAVENAQTLPALKLFKFELGQLPTFLLAYISLAVGLVIGWVAHAMRVRRKKREADAASTAEQQQKPQESQGAQQAE